MFTWTRKYNPICRAYFSSGCFNHQIFFLFGWESSTFFRFPWLPWKTNMTGWNSNYHEYEHEIPIKHWDFRASHLRFSGLFNVWFFFECRPTLPNRTSKRSERVAKLRQYEDGPPDLSAVQLARSVWGNSGFFSWLKWWNGNLISLSQNIWYIYNIYYVYIYTNIYHVYDYICMYMNLYFDSTLGVIKQFGCCHKNDRPRLTYLISTFKLDLAF